MLDNERNNKRMVVISSIASKLCLLTSTLISARERFSTEIDSTREEETIMTKMITRTMFKINRRVFGVTLLFTCCV